ncbi:ATP-binding protein [Duganella violaceipulchra]|uniref:histidine kinase n=1 Tax=Duganella violaceipulchra TaxID=2849652 RepID=A0AA41HAR6_9BURK|nr:ATP-binding protein [Duganella violaceicalia]MBV6322640.1 response regulator [Duganella violaceicalia]MCP2010854.1 PAS domain S-box-containing protein [Duganella violaceicalia]
MILPHEPTDAVTPEPPTDDAALPASSNAQQDLLSAREALRQSQLELRALANSMPQLAWIAEQDGTMIWYNQPWYAYTGTTPEQMSGGGWRQVYAPDCVAPMLERWEHSRATGLPYELEVPIRSANGEFRWFLTRANPVHDAAGRVLRWFGTSTDVDQVKRVQEALRDETAVLELVNRTGSALASTRDLHPLLQEVTDAATSISGARFGAFFYRGADGHGRARELHMVSSGAPAGCAAFGRPDDGALSSAELCMHGTVRSNDWPADPRHGRDAPRHRLPPGQPPVRSYLAAPVALRSGVVIGCLFLGHPEPSMFSERTERIIGGIAAQAAVAIDNARLVEASRQAAEERKILLDSERQARADVERTSQMKDEFLATLSHELRTPLTAILGWAQVLRRGSRDQADLHRGLQTIERNARALAQLIEDLLDISSIASGKVRLDMLALAPAAIVAAAIDTVRPAAEAKQIRIERDFEAAPGMVAGDANRLQQIIWNLLTNALKFTPAGGRIQVGIQREGDQIAVTVRDNGIGIAPAFLGHVFERFRQADATTTRRHGGLGLGLSIVKHLVEQHGGTVSAASEGEGRGACFTVRLPRRRGGHEPLGAAGDGAPAERSVAHDLSGLQVLVVDDEDDARELIKRILADCNADVLTAATAGEALGLLQHARPDLMLSDLGMPEVDGYGLLDRIRALGPARGGDLPAIALTAFARSEDRIRALSSGFLAHISKPVEPNELIAKVAALGAAHRHARTAMSRL